MTVQKQFTIDNCVTAFSMDKTTKTKVGYQFWFADPDFIDGRTLKMSVVAPRKTAGPYTSFYCPSNVEHGIRNVGDTELKYLVIKKYQK